MPQPKSPGRPAKPRPTPPPTATPPASPPPASPSPAPPPSPKLELPPAKLAEPQPNPLRNPPPPELPHHRPGRPPKGESRAAGVASAPPGGGDAGAGGTPPKAKRELPGDPAQLAAELATYRVQWEPVTSLVDQLASTLPPHIGLGDKEKEALTNSGARVLYVHGGHLDPLWGLALCLAAIAVPRFVAYQQQKRGTAPPAPPLQPPKPEAAAA